MTADVVAAEPITDFIWCENCGEPHAANFETKTVTMHDTNVPCETYAQAMVGGAHRVDTLPAGWDREFHAAYDDTWEGGGGRHGRTSTDYILVPKQAPMLECHKVMYFLTDDAS